MPLTDDNIRKAKEFAFTKWKERAGERGYNEPVDLSSSCKFCSLFVKHVFGGSIKGNYDHHYNVVNNQIVDLSGDSEDVLKLNTPYYHDSAFFGNKEHLESLSSCMPRAKDWAQAFINNAMDQAADEDDRSFFAPQ